MDATYYQATRVGRKSTPDVFLADIQEIMVGTYRSRHDRLDDDEIESIVTADDEQAAQWLISRGCAAHEAARIVGTARRLLMSQSTGQGPTDVERVLGQPISH